VLVAVMEWDLLDRNYDRAADEMKCSTLTISKFAVTPKIPSFFLFMWARAIPD
jgi:hypothetical protein